MDATEGEVLYIWIHGAPYQAPEIYTLAAPTMSLAEFRDRYVDTSRDHLIIQVSKACDRPTRVDQACQGQSYRVALVPVQEKGITAGPDDAAPAPGIAETNVTAIKGIGQRTAALLRTKANISSAQDLLSTGATPQGRQKLQSQTNLSPKLILRWVQLADLMRIEGVGSDASQLLWDAGVTSITHLAAQNPKTLLKRLGQPTTDPGGLQHLPALVQVTDWVQQASKMQAIVTL